MLGVNIFFGLICVWDENVYMEKDFGRFSFCWYVVVLRFDLMWVV